MSFRLHNDDEKIREEGKIFIFFVIKTKMTKIHKKKTRKKITLECSIRSISFYTNLEYSKIF